MAMRKGEFIEDGTLYCRGEEASKYKKGDKLTVLSDFNDKLVEVVVTDGESTGMIVYMEKTMIKYSME